MKNPVLKTTRPLLKNAQYVSMNIDKIREVAQQFASERLEIPKWDLPIYPDQDAEDEDVIDFICLENTINFAFTEFEEPHRKYSVEYNGVKWKGASGMVASLKRAMSEEVPIFDAKYLKDIPQEDMDYIFRACGGSPEIPMLEERHQIFQEVGRRLSRRYEGHFYNIVEVSNGLLFNNGRGFIELLTSTFPSFDDSVIAKNEEIRFDKRAQLAAAILYGRFQNKKPMFKDINRLTAFADYQLPRGLRELGILEYSPELADKVDNQVLIPAESQEELEIRAFTIHASDILRREINKLRPDDPVNALHVDYKLWSESRKLLDVRPHHLTRTIAY